MLMPGDLRSTMNCDRPAWRSSPSGSVRHSTKNQSARCALEVHSLVPVSSQPPSTRSPRVRTDARSEPLPGSLMPMAKNTSAATSLGRK
jgi:hypothetical protein